MELSELYTNISLQRSPQDMNSHDQLVLAFLESGFGKLLIEISENSAERDFHMWILEIFAMLLKEHVSFARHYVFFSYSFY